MVIHMMKKAATLAGGYVHGITSREITKDSKRRNSVQANNTRIFSEEQAIIYGLYDVWKSRLNSSQHRHFCILLMQYFPRARSIALNLQQEYDKKEANKISWLDSTHSSLSNVESQILDPQIDSPLCAKLIYDLQKSALTSHPKFPALSYMLRTAPLTAIIGPHQSGKSTVLHLIIDERFGTQTLGALCDALTPVQQVHWMNGSYLLNVRLQTIGEKEQEVGQSVQKKQFRHTHSIATDPLKLVDHWISTQTEIVVLEADLSHSVVCGVIEHIFSTLQVKSVDHCFSKHDWTKSSTEGTLHKHKKPKMVSNMDSNKDFGTFQPPKPRLVLESTSTAAVSPWLLSQLQIVNWNSDSIGWDSLVNTFAVCAEWREDRRQAVLLWCSVLLPRSLDLMVHMWFSHPITSDTDFSTTLKTSNYFHLLSHTTIKSLLQLLDGILRYLFIHKDRLTISRNKSMEGTLNNEGDVTQKSLFDSEFSHSQVNDTVFGMAFVYAWTWAFGGCLKERERKIFVVQIVEKMTQLQLPLPPAPRDITRAADYLFWWFPCVSSKERTNPPQICWTRLEHNMTEKFVCDYVPSCGRNLALYIPSLYDQSQLLVVRSLSLVSHSSSKVLQSAICWKALCDRYNIGYQSSQSSCNVVIVGSRGTGRSSSCQFFSAGVQETYRLKGISGIDEKESNKIDEDRNMKTSWKASNSSTTKLIMDCTSNGSQIQEWWHSISDQWVLFGNVTKQPVVLFIEDLSKINNIEVLSHAIQVRLSIFQLLFFLLLLFLIKI